MSTEITDGLYQAKPGEEPHVEIHVDVPRETFEQIRNGEKSIRIKDRETKHMIDISQSTFKLNWKTVVFLLGVVATLGMYTWKISGEVAKVQNGVEQITKIQQEFGSLRTDFAGLRSDISTLMGLYTKMESEIRNSTGTYVTQSQAQANWEQRQRLMDAEHRYLEKQIEDIHRHMEVYHPRGIPPPGN